MVMNRFTKKTTALLPQLAVSSLAVLAMLLPAAGVFGAARGYATDDNQLKPGMVVALSEASTPESPKVERAALDLEPKVIGVTTELGEEAVTVADGESIVYVQNTGEARVFVSDLNGNVAKGDLLAPSPLLGILMKADESTAPIVGIALEEFAAASAETKQIQENEGTREVNIARLKINLDHMAASNQQASATDSSIERLGRAIVGKDVGELQVITALLIFLVVLVAEGGIIYGAISSAITALGRNPMASKVIRGEMIRVVGVALAVLLVGVAAIYAVLWI